MSSSEFEQVLDQALATIRGQAVQLAADRPSPAELRTRLTIQSLSAAHSLSQQQNEQARAEVTQVAAIAAYLVVLLS